MFLGTFRHTYWLQKYFWVWLRWLEGLEELVGLVGLGELVELVDLVWLVGLARLAGRWLQLVWRWLEVGNRSQKKSQLKRGH